MVGGGIRKPDDTVALFERCGHDPPPAPQTRSRSTNLRRRI
jgi:hypothetical protein